MGFCFILKHKITLFYLISIVFIYHSLFLTVIIYYSLSHSLSLVVIHCHSFSFLVTRCTTRCTIRCHSLYHSLSFIVTRCHSSYHWSVFLQTIFSDWVTVLKWKKAILNPTSCYSKVLNNRKEGQNKRYMQPGATNIFLTSSNWLVNKTEKNQVNISLYGYILCLIACMPCLRFVCGYELVWIDVCSNFHCSEFYFLVVCT